MNDAITGQSHLRLTLPQTPLSGPQTPSPLLLVNLPYISSIGAAQLLCGQRRAVLEESQTKIHHCPTLHSFSILSGKD